MHDFVSDISPDYSAVWIGCPEGDYALHCQNNNNSYKPPLLNVPPTKYSNAALSLLINRIKSHSPYIDAIIWALLVDFFYEVLELLAEKEAQDERNYQGEIPLTHRLAIQNVLFVLRRDMHQDIKLESLAQRVGYTKNYLCSLFMAVTGESIFGYLRRIRLERAKELLLYSNKPIREIAAMVGYSNTSSFNRAFKGYFNISPHMLRANGTLTGSD